VKSTDIKISIKIQLTK